MACAAREGDGDKRRGHTFAAVETIGRALPDVEVTTVRRRTELAGRDDAAMHADSLGLSLEPGEQG